MKKLAVFAAAICVLFILITALTASASPFYDAQGGGGGGGPSSGAYDLDGETLTCNAAGTATAACPADDWVFTVPAGGSIGLSDGTNTTTLAPSASGLAINTRLEISGGRLGARNSESHKASIGSAGTEYLGVYEASPKVR